MAKEELKVVAQEPVELSNESQAKTTIELPSLAQKESSIAPNDPKNTLPQDPPQEEDAPAPPPRPISPRTQAKAELKLAFPAVDDTIINTVLIASLGHLDPAFNALLYYLDPSSGVEIPVPTVPSASTTNTTVSQAEEDEKLARRLQQEFEREERERHRLRKDQRRREGREQRNSVSRQSLRQQNPESGDEFEQIKETFTQGFEEAKTTLNGWVSGLAKKFLDVPDDQEPPRPNRPSNNSPKLFGALGGSLYNKRPNNRFDEDPEILPSDFHGRISLNDNDDDAPPLPLRRAVPEQSDSFTEPVNKRWQPLSTEGANSDAFLVTDSEDEEVSAPPAVPTKDKKDTIESKELEEDKNESGESKADSKVEETETK